MFQFLTFSKIIIIKHVMYFEITFESFLKPFLVYEFKNMSGVRYIIIPFRIVLVYLNI